MSNRHILLILLLLPLLLLAIRLPWLWNSVTDHGIEAENGKLDLSNWDFTDHPKLLLDGEWEFFPGELNPPGEKTASAPEFLTLPASSDALEKFGHGAGTYRLSIQMPEQQVQKVRQVKIPSRMDNFALYINGRLLLDNLDDSSSEKIMDPSFFSHGASFPIPEDQLVDIVILVGETKLPRHTGILKSISFGSEASLDAAANRNTANQLLVFTVAMLAALYALGFFLYRRRQKHFLYFSLATFSLGFATVLDDDRLLLEWIPLEYVWAVKSLFICYISVGIFLLLFIQDFFKEYRDHRLLKICKWLLYAAAIAILAMPIHLTAQVGLFTFFILCAFFLLAAGLMGRTLQERKEVIFLMLAAISAISSYLWGIYKSRSAVELPYYPFDILAAFLFLSIFLFFLFTRIAHEYKITAMQLQEELTSKEQFLSRTAYELKNPLYSIMNLTHKTAQQEQERLSDQAKDDLSMVLAVGQQAAMTINSLVDMAWITESQFQLKKRKLNLEKIISGILDLLSIQIQHKKIKVSMDISPELLYIEADENRLLQILYNLIDNAVKYTENGSIMIRAVNENGNAIIQIIDTGNGMDAETVTRIFLPFNQTQDANGFGFGLGLAISRQLAELHGGTLTASSKLTEGSVFTLTLPPGGTDDTSPARDTFPAGKSTSIAAPVTAAYELQQSLQKAEGLTFRPRILLVEDDPVSMRVITGILSESDYEVITAGDSDEALERLSEYEWDLAVINVLLPKVSGYQLTRIIREKYSLLELPILQLTAKDRLQDIYHGYLSGANDYISKPFQRLELQIRVNALASLKRTREEKIRTESALMIAQIKPHFLFNTLHTIAALSETEPSRMVSLLEHFGNYLQRSFNLENLHRLVPLEHELDLVRSYLYIEKERFGDRIQVVWELGDSHGIQIPPLSIQTLVENSLRHGILSRVEGGQLKISIRHMESWTEIAISDDGVGIPEEKVEILLSGKQSESAGIGIFNTDSRLKQIYGEGLKIDSILGKGTTISFKIRPVTLLD